MTRRVCSVVSGLLVMVGGVQGVSAQDPKDGPSGGGNDDIPAALRAGAEEAHSEAKYLWVTVYRPGCADCDRFLNVILATGRHRAWIDAYAIEVRLNFEDSHNAWFIGKHKIVDCPTVLFMTDDLTELGRVSGRDALTRLDTFRVRAIQGDQIKPTTPGIFPFKGEYVVVGTLKNADRLFASGKLEEAFKRYDWCLNHRVATSNNFHMNGHLDHLIKSLVRLGADYPPARQALVSFVSRLEQEILLKKRSDAFALNAIHMIRTAMEDQAKLLSFYDKLKAQSPESAQLAAFRRVIFETLLKDRRYDDLRYVVADEKDLDQFLLQVAQGIHQRDEVRRILSAHYEILLGIGEDQRAGRVADELINYDRSPGSFVALAEAGYRTGRAIPDLLKFARSAQAISKGRDPKATIILAKLLARQTKTRREAIRLLETGLKANVTPAGKQAMKEALERIRHPNDADRESAAATGGDRLR